MLKGTLNGLYLKALYLRWGAFDTSRCTTQSGNSVDRSNIWEIVGVVNSWRQPLLDPLVYTVYDR